MAWDSQLLLWIQEYVRTPFLDPIISRFTALGDHGIIWIAVTFVLLILPKTRRVGLMCLLSLIMMELLCNDLLQMPAEKSRHSACYSGSAHFPVKALRRGPLSDGCDRRRFFRYFEWHSSHGNH